MFTISYRFIIVDYQMFQDVIYGNCINRIPLNYEANEEPNK